MFFDGYTVSWDIKDTNIVSSVTGNNTSYEELVPLMDTFTVCFRSDTLKY